MREECAKFADRLTGLFSEIILKTMTMPLLRELEEQEITLSQLHALTYVGERRACSIGEIADGLDVTHPAAVKMIDRLARKGMVTRRVSALDHRQAEIQITPAGRDLVHRVGHARSERLSRVLEQMTADERQGLIRGLERFIGAYSSARALDEICRSCQTLLPTDCRDWIPEEAVAAAGGSPEECN
jgi:DNA-binding MarR family transcriptional regulator